MRKETFSRNGFYGWQNGRKDFSSAFGYFLGRYAKDDPFPYKEYTVPTDADHVKFQIDFYEIDSWDADNRYGPDCIYIWIDDTKVFIGIFGSDNDEGRRKGSMNGITWRSKALAGPENIGFGSAKDQKHRITMLIPKSYFADGKMKVTLETRVNGPKEDESSGWDNIKVFYLYDCPAEDYHRQLPGKSELSDSDDLFAEDEVLFADVGPEPERANLD